MLFPEAARRVPVVSTIPRAHIDTNALAANSRRLAGAWPADGRLVYAKLHFTLQIALRRLRGASRDPESGLVVLRGAFS